MKKPLVISAIIIFPVLLILLFQYAADHRFDIPVYYENGIKADTLVDVACLSRAAVEYKVSNPAWTDGKHHILHFERIDGPVLKTRLEELERVQDVFYDQPNILLNTYVNNVSLKASDISDYNQRIQFYEQFWKVEELDSATWHRTKRCELVMTQLDSRTVLVDAFGRIRGYYNIVEREETDRLIAELKILLSNDEFGE